MDDLTIKIDQLLYGKQTIKKLDDGTTRMIRSEGALKDKKTHLSQEQLKEMAKNLNISLELLNQKLLTTKMDDSALAAGRKPIGVRRLGEQVAPKHMTRKEYEHFLCHKFNFKIGKGWDGVEKLPHRQNWEPDESQNIETIEQAWKFLGLSPNGKAPDGVEKRQQSRRKNNKDLRAEKINRRNLKERRKEENINNITYFITVIILL